MIYIDNQPIIGYDTMDLSIQYQESIDKKILGIIYRYTINIETKIFIIIKSNEYVIQSANIVQATINTKHYNIFKNQQKTIYFPVFKCLLSGIKQKKDYYIFSFISEQYFKPSDIE